MQACTELGRVVTNRLGFVYIYRTFTTFILVHDAVHAVLSNGSMLASFLLATWLAHLKSHYL